MSVDDQVMVDDLLRAAVSVVDRDSDGQLAALEARLLAEHADRLAGRTFERPARDLERVRRSRRTRRLASLGAVVSVAAAIALAVAFAPWERETSRLPAPGSAAAALLAAGEAAGDAEWRPIGDDEYVHRFSVSYAPSFDGIDPQSMTIGHAQATESWFARDGSGQVLSISGGSGDPADLPSFYRDPKTGKIAGIGSSSPKPGEEYDVRRSIANPNSVNLMAWPRSGVLPFQRGWVRTEDGFLKTDDFVMDERTMGRAEDRERNVTQWWGAAPEAIDAANEDPDPAHAVEVLLRDHLASDDRQWRGGGGTVNGQPIPTATVSPEQRDREDSIQHAVHLLGNAPLAPQVRRELFAWLARQPGATLTERVRDEFGRIGTRVRFSADTDETVPPRRVTARELVEGAGRLATKGRDLSKIDMDRVYVVDDLRIERAWRVEAVVDLERGELLQSAFASQERVIGKRPFFATYSDGARIDERDPGGGSMTGGGQVILAREVTTDLEPVAAVCSTSPEVCR